MFSRNNKSAQQIIEYLLLFSAVVLSVLAFVVNQGYFSSSVSDVINESIYSVDVDEDLWTYLWVETGCFCDNSCGEGTFTCPGGATCQREDGLIVPDQICIDLDLDLPMTGTPCVGENCCGNGVINTAVGEECDGGLFPPGALCSDYGYYPTSVGLTCTAICTIDPSGCNRCGDGILYANAALEPCEPPPAEQFQGQTCETEVAPGVLGTLSCNFNCTINTDGCFECGDGIKNGSEDCDGADWGMVGQCSDIPDNPPYWADAASSLSCNPDCTFDKSGCFYCGDGIWQDDFEDCEVFAECYDCVAVYGAVLCSGRSCYGYPGCSPGGGPGNDLCNSGNGGCFPPSDELRRCTCDFSDCEYDPPDCTPGTPPDGVRDDWCPGADEGLMDDVGITVVATPANCDGTKCQKACNPPFELDGGACRCPDAFSDIDGVCQCVRRLLMKGVGCPADQCYREGCGSRQCNREMPLL